MIDHLLILETRPGSADLLSTALAGWDAQTAPKVLSVVRMGHNQPDRDFHTLFQMACEEIEGFIRERKARPSVARVVVLADQVAWESLDPLKAVDKFPSNLEDGSILVAQLILAFPEALWGFAYTRGNAPANLLIPDAHILEHWVERGKPPPFDPLMDVTGLRDYVRSRAGYMSSSPLKLQCRKRWAVAMDDESAYAYFNAYTEYRHGFRAVPVDSWAVAEYVCGEKAAMKPAPIDHTEDRVAPMVSIEDLYMSFPDVPSSHGGKHLSKLADRDAAFPLLARSKHRIILTSGHKRKGVSKTLRDSTGRKPKRLLKPIGGMFSMWKQSDLWKKLRRMDPDCRAWIGGYAPDYHPGIQVNPQEGANHSAPGALLAVAETLMERVARLKTEIVTVEDVVLGAVLATDAFELLASRTPTLSLDALVLKHEFETRAECGFNGVQTHLDVGSRLLKIQNAVKMLSKWYDPWHQDIACWNAEAVVISKVKAVFHEHERFDEEMSYATRSRTLHRRLWFRERLGKVAGTWLRCVNPFYWLAWYVGFLLKGIPTFVMILTLWIGALTCGFHEVETAMSNEFTPATVVAPADAKQNQDEFVAQAGPWTRALADSFSCMVSVGTPLHANAIEDSGKMVGLAYLLSCFGMGIGFLHVGILISHLYSVVARKG